MGLVLWTQCFLEAQGYKVSNNVVYQDNQSAMLLENHGQMSSSKHTWHINICYFFVTNQIKHQNLCVAYCPTDDMLADFFYETTARKQVLETLGDDLEFWNLQSYCCL
jgi:hypothetical protein